MVKDAEEHAAEDKARREAADTRNTAEQLAYSVDKLIADMQMEHAGRITAEEMPYLRPSKELHGCPDYRQWVGGYHHSLERRGWFFDLLTDPTKTKVYVWISCI